jgi:uncharacterized protein
MAIWLLLLLHTYIGWRLAPQLPAPAAAALAAWLLASALLIPGAFFGRRASDRRWADRMTWAGMLALGAFSMLLVLTLLRDVLLLVLLPFTLPPFAGPTAQAVPLLALAAVTLGAFNARRRARVRRVRVPIAGLPQELSGFTIVQISDVHVGPTVKRPYVQAVVDAVNRLDADCVAITGDLVDGRVADLHDDVAPLAGLRSRHGTFFVTGNHEFYSGAAEWTALLRSMDITVLDHAHVVLERGGARLLLAGVPDFAAGRFDPRQRSDPQRALAGAPSDVAARVLLAHQPRSAPAAGEAGFDLQLSGHTHGGQFWPWNLFVPLQQPFTAGLHRLGRLWVYTSRGTGYWGPPLRLGAPSEITLLRLDAGAGDHEHNARITVR